MLTCCFLCSAAKSDFWSNKSYFRELVSFPGHSIPASLLASLPCSICILNCRSVRSKKICTWETWYSTTPANTSTETIPALLSRMAASLPRLRSMLHLMCLPVSTVKLVYSALLDVVLLNFVTLCNFRGVHSLGFQNGVGLRCSYSCD